MAWVRSQWCFRDGKAAGGDVVKTYPLARVFGKCDSSRNREEGHVSQTDCASVPRQDAQLLGVGGVASHRPRAASPRRQLLGRIDGHGAEELGGVGRAFSRAAAVFVAPADAV